MSENSKFTARNLNLYYGDFHALKNINFEIEANKITALIGPSGCGKSTFLKTLNRMNDFVEGCKIEGDVLLDGKDIYKTDMSAIELRQRVGMVFQQPNPFPKSIYENVAYGPRIRGIKKKSELDEIVETSLREVGIWDEFKDRLHKSALGLSGGQQQRLCIARTVAVHPEVVLMDEPTGSGCGNEEKVHHRDRHAQHAAGEPDLRHDGLLPAGRADRGRCDKGSLPQSEEQEDGRIHHRKVRLTAGHGREQAAVSDWKRIVSCAVEDDGD